MHLALALYLLANLGLGLVRVLRGPRPGDRMLAAQLFGTTGVAVLVLLAHGLDAPALRDVALVFALLAIVTTAAFLRGAPSGPPPSPAEGRGAHAGRRPEVGR